MKSYIALHPFLGCLPRPGFSHLSPFPKKKGKRGKTSAEREKELEEKGRNIEENERRRSINLEEHEATNADLMLLLGQMKRNRTDFQANFSLNPNRNRSIGDLVGVGWGPLCLSGPCFFGFWANSEKRIMYWKYTP